MPSLPCREGIPIPFLPSWEGTSIPSLLGMEGMGFCLLLGSVFNHVSKRMSSCPGHNNSGKARIFLETSLVLRTQDVPQKTLTFPCSYWRLNTLFLMNDFKVRS